MPPRLDVQCPRCESLERHRLFVLACEALSLFATPRVVLHFAPEPTLRAYVQPRAARYVTADITGVGVDRQESIEATSFPDAAFDMVISSHVFEHVDDRRAIAEMCRILRPSGVLVCMVPLIEGWDTTYENPGVLTPRERDLHFGQSDHVRYYGRDFRDRLRAGGFAVREYTAEGGPAVVHGLLRGEKIFVASPTERSEASGTMVNGQR
jgi:SAM-dependent methyltransferase